MPNTPVPVLPPNPTTIGTAWLAIYPIFWAAPVKILPAVPNPFSAKSLLCSSPFWSAVCSPVIIGPIPATACAPSTTEYNPCPAACKPTPANAWVADSSLGCAWALYSSLVPTKPVPPASNSASCFALTCAFTSATLAGDISSGLLNKASAPKAPATVPIPATVAPATTLTAP